MLEGDYQAMYVNVGSLVSRMKDVLLPALTGQPNSSGVSAMRTEQQQQGRAGIVAEPSRCVPSDCIADGDHLTQTVASGGLAWGSGLTCGASATRIASRTACMSSRRWGRSGRRQEEAVVWSAPTTRASMSRPTTWDPARRACPHRPATTPSVRVSGAFQCASPV